MSSKAATSRLTVVVDLTRKSPVVRCSGKLVAGETGDFYVKVKALVPEHKRIVLDFTDLTHMDSSGIGTLVRLYVHAKSGDSVLELVNVGPSVRQLLGITHLLSVFQLIAEHNIRMG